MIARVGDKDVSVFVGRDSQRVPELTRAAPALAVGGGSSDWAGAQEAGMVVLPNRINEAAGIAAGLANGTDTSS